MSQLKRNLVCMLLISVALSFGTHLLAQDWAKPMIRNQQRVDLRHLGYPYVNEIPPYNSAITSLLTAHDGNIYGGTTGDQAYLFVYNPTINKVRHLGKIPGAESIHHALVEDAQGTIYLGTGKSMFKKIPLSPGGQFEQIDSSLWDDITHYYRDYPGGHLYKYDPAVSNAHVKLPEMEAEVTDLGIPVPHNSIYALTIDPTGTVIYGLTYPDAQLFVYTIASQQFKVVGPVDQQIVFHGPERDWRSVSRALICDRSGKVYFSGTHGELLYYSPQSGMIQSTGQQIPGDYYYAQIYEDYAVAEYFAHDSFGIIYGGSSDGYLFSFNPQNMQLANLGKPRADRRLRCLTVGHDGKVYLIAGERPQTSAVSTKLYAYDPAHPGFTDYGMLIVDRSPHYYRRGYQFDSMTTGKDGAIFLGESEYRSRLFLLIPPFESKKP